MGVSGVMLWLDRGLGLVRALFVSASRLDL